MQKKFLIAGLGNPGPKYEKNRHNIGFRIIDFYAASSQASLNRHDKFEAITAFIKEQNSAQLLIKPMTFMNLSGKSIRFAADYYKIEKENILIICDDFAIPLGTLRLRTSGSDGGHNGLKSVNEHMGGNNFSRLRVGVGPLPEGKASPDFVLSDFTKNENNFLDKVIIPQACNTVRCFIENGADAAMSKYNKIYEPDL